MSYAPIFSEPASNLSTDIRTNNLNYSKNSKSSNSQISRNGKRSKTRTHSSVDLENYTLLVHCHLCWDWVWQRPQQFISRLSEKRKAIFVETIAPDPQLVSPTLRFRKPEQYPN